MDSQCLLEPRFLHSASHQIFDVHCFHFSARQTVNPPIFIPFPQLGQGEMGAEHGPGFNANRCCREKKVGPVSKAMAAQIFSLSTERLEGFPATIRAHTRV